MKTLAFLQNQWVRDPARAQAIIEKYGEASRGRLIATLLFNGCWTGRRLQKAFGARCREIIWENAAREIGNVPASCFKPDIEHMQRQVDAVQPGVVLAFGVHAARGMDSVRTNAVIIKGPHPAARQRTVGYALMAMAAQWVKEKS